MFLGLCLAALVLVADQISKYYILNEVLEDRAMIIYTSWFNLVKAWNTGVSFSMFNDMGAWGTFLLSVLAISIIGFLVLWLQKEPSRLVQVALGFIIGGAIGNLIDRVRLGAVFDFLDFHIADAHWPAFNVADSFICIGAIIIIVHSLFNKEKSVI